MNEKELRGLYKLDENELIEEYRKRFGEGPPLFGYPVLRFEVLLRRCLRKNKKLRPAWYDIPKGAIL